MLDSNIDPRIKSPLLYQLTNARRWNSIIRKGRPKRRRRPASCAGSVATEAAPRTDALLRSAPRPSDDACPQSPAQAPLVWILRASSGKSAPDVSFSARSRALRNTSGGSGDRLDSARQVARSAGPGRAAPCRLPCPKEVDCNFGSFATAAHQPALCCSLTRRPRRTASKRCYAAAKSYIIIVGQRLVRRPRDAGCSCIVCRSRVNPGARCATSGSAAHRLSLRDAARCEHRAHGQSNSVILSRSCRPAPSRHRPP